MHSLFPCYLIRAVRLVPLWQLCHLKKNGGFSGFESKQVTDRFHVRQIEGQFISFVRQTIVHIVEVIFSVQKSVKVSSFEDLVNLSS